VGSLMTTAQETVERQHGWGPRRVGRCFAATVVLCAAVVPAALYGLLSQSAYRGYSRDLVVSSRAQDVFTLLVLPVLVLATVRAARGSLAAHVVWLGLVFYLAYSYAIYLIGWQQNRVFLLYVVIVTVSAGCLLDGLARIDVGRIGSAVVGLRTRGLGWFLVVIGTAFVGLWLSDVAPSAFGGRAPEQLGLGGAPYAVYVLDLTVALPVVILVGIALLRAHPMSVVLGGVVLVKVVTLFSALWLAVLARVGAGMTVPFTPDLVPSALLPAVCVAVLLRAGRRLGPPSAGWLRPHLWPTGNPQGGDDGTTDQR
jgi:hypothetical protein